MKSKAKTVAEYLKAVPGDRKQAIGAVLKVVRRNLPKGYEERFTWGMITWQVPLSVYPDTYNGQPLMYAALASQKNHMAVYLCSVYGSAACRAELEKGFKAAGKRLDAGKACIRFRKLEDLPLEVIGRAVAALPMEDFVRIAKAVARKK